MSNLIDWQYYLERYPDLQINGVITKQDAVKHWQSFGEKEGRVALRTPPFFDWHYYVEKYPDLRKHGIKTEHQALKHWLSAGEKEGRVATRTPPFFDWHYYVEKHNDLRKHGIKTEQQALKHWLSEGEKEGRVATRTPAFFDWQYYLQKHNDLQTNGVKTEQQAINHWLTWGGKEKRVATRTPKLFDWQYYLHKYPDVQKNGIKTEQESIVHWLSVGEKEGRNMASPLTIKGQKNIIIYTHMDNFNINDGGTVAQYYLAQLLDEKFGQNVRIVSCSGKKNINNPLFNKYYNYEFPINDDTIVVYCEGTIGNPLNTNSVVRWMLSELGQNVPRGRADTWGKKELVYYFNSELKFDKNPEKIGTVYKSLSVLYLNPSIKNFQHKNRADYCFTLRKGTFMHKNIQYIHPEGSFELIKTHTQSECIGFFNKYKYFVSYDPLTFFTVIAALCGCISIVYKKDGMTKQEWIQTTAASEYIKYKGLDNLYGIAYGLEDIKYAEDTLHLVEEQWLDITTYLNQKTVINFINDINNFKQMSNTIKNNYY